MIKEYLCKVVKKVKIRNKILLYLERPVGFDFEPGQFVLFVAETKIGTISRAYSIASTPDENHLIFYISLLSKGAMSTVLKDIRADDELKIRGPFGEVTPEKIGQDLDKIILVGAGSGIAPIRPLAWWYKKHTDVNVTVYHQARYEDELVFMEDFLRWKIDFRGFVSRQPPKNETLKYGYITDDISKIIKPYQNKKIKVVAFGPRGFVEKIKTVVDETILITEGW